MFRWNNLQTSRLLHVTLIVRTGITVPREFLQKLEQKEIYPVHGTFEKEKLDERNYRWKLGTVICKIKSKGNVLQLLTSSVWRWYFSQTRRHLKIGNNESITQEPQKQIYLIFKTRFSPRRGSRFHSFFFSFFSKKEELSISRIKTISISSIPKQMQSYERHTLYINVWLSSWRGFSANFLINSPFSPSLS